MPVVGEVEIAWRMLAQEWIAVTGSNGKTTTTEWIGHIHREAGLPVRVAGNVGTAVSTLATETLDPATTIVCETSSFQLEDTALFAPEGAVLLNLTPDHLDRHGSFAAYTQAKLNVFARQGNDDVAVAPLGLGIEDLGGCARRVCFGDGPGAELQDRAGQLWWDEEPLLAADAISLPGRHNRQNAMAAAAITLARGVDPAAVVAGLTTFGGVAHRLELVGTRDGVRYVNDSKATNIDAAVTGLESFPGGVHVILGGRGLGADLAPLVAAVRERAAAAYLDRRGRAAARRGARRDPVVDGRRHRGGGRGGGEGGPAGGDGPAQPRRQVLRPVRRTSRPAATTSARSPAPRGRDDASPARQRELAQRLDQRGGARHGRGGRSRRRGHGALRRADVAAHLQPR